MKNKKRLQIWNKLLIGILALIVILGFVLSAKADSSPEDELDNLISQLDSSGYGWLANYKDIKGGLSL